MSEPKPKRGCFRKIAFALFLLIVCGGGTVLYSIYKNLDQIVRIGTERGLQFVLEVPATVAGASVKPRQGSIGVSGIDIPNPDGYDADHAFKLGEVEVAMTDFQSLNTNTIVIDTIRLKEPDIVFEKTLKSSNFQDLIASASRFGSEDKADPAAKEAPGKNLRIRRIIVESTTVSVTVPATGGQTIGVTIPEIEITDFDTEEGVPATNVLSLTLKIIMSTIVAYGVDIVPGFDDLKASMEAAGEFVTGTVKDVGAAAKEGVKLAGEAAGEAVDAAKEGAEKAAEVAKEGAAEVGKAVSSGVETATESTKAITEKATEAAGEAAKGIKDAAGSVTDSLGGLLGGKKTEEKATETATEENK